MFSVKLHMAPGSACRFFFSPKSFDDYSWIIHSRSNHCWELNKAPVLSGMLYLNKYKSVPTHKIVLSIINKHALLKWRLKWSKLQSKSTYCLFALYRCVVFCKIAMMLCDVIMIVWPEMSHLLNWVNIFLEVVQQLFCFRHGRGT